MKAMWRRKMGKAFTLVELLVVIAIIAILAALVLPRVGGALLNARVLDASVRAKSIVQDIFAKDAGSIYIPTASSWPRRGGLDVEAWTFPDSTRFFHTMVTSGTMNVNFQFFAVPRVPAEGGAAAFAGSAGRNNAWCVVAGITDSYPETAPAIFTRNLNIPNAMTDPIISGGRVNLRDDREPFGSRAFAFATKGGTAYGLKDDDLVPQAFTNIFVVTDVHGNALTNQVLRPGGEF